MSRPSRWARAAPGGDVLSGPVLTAGPAADGATSAGLSAVRFSSAGSSMAELSLTGRFLAELSLAELSLAELSLAELSLAELSLAELSLAELLSVGFLVGPVGVPGAFGRSSPVAEDGDRPVWSVRAPDRVVAGWPG